jgi:hypothetical protein
VIRSTVGLLLAFAVSLHAFAEAEEGLNVSIAVFDPGIPEDKSLHRELNVFPRIRNIEAMFLPFVVHDALRESGEWGAIRIVPESDPAAELLIDGRIEHSDGATLTLYIKAVDATGRVWIDRSYTGDVTDGYAKDDEEVTESHEPLYAAIVNDLLRVLDGLSNKDRVTIAEVSLLRYGNQVAPAAFGEFVTVSPEGDVTINRLPAVDDPMIQRIALVRETEYVITDAMDARFRELSAEIASVYDIWREFRRKTLKYAEEDLRRAEATLDDGSAGSYESLKSAYDNYRYHRITEQEQDRLAVAFYTEVGPRIEAMEARVGEMQEWVDTRYDEWRRILEEFFELEADFGE